MYQKFIKSKTTEVFSYLVSWNVKVGVSKKFPAPRTLISSLTNNHEDQDNDVVT